MRELPRILSSYQDIDACLESLRADQGVNAAQVELRQVLNNQAYFLLCWGPLETAINDKCRAAIGYRRNDPSWQIRRGWDLYNSDDPRLSGLHFEHRVMLVLDAKEGKKSPYARTMFYYEIRNKVAHGKLETTRVNVPAVAQEFYIIQAALNRAA